MVVIGIFAISLYCYKSIVNLGIVVVIYNIWLMKASDEGIWVN